MKTIQITILRTVVLVLAVAVPMFGTAQTSAKTMTEAEVRTTFDKAMKTYDGKLLHRVLREVEAKNLTPTACSAFLKRFVKPWYEGNSIQKLPNGKFAKLNAPDCQVAVLFQPTGGTGYGIVEKRKEVFCTPTIKEGQGYKSTVSLGQVLFAVAYSQTRTPGRNRIEVMKDAQKLFESWVPELKKMGIRGSVDPETGKFDTWETIVKASRTEVKKRGG